MTRRTLLGMAACTPLLAQQRVGPPPHEHGPNVFLNYDQIELDAAYDQASYAPNQTQVQQRNARNSELTRARLGAPLRVSYGPTEIEKIDIFPSSLPLASRGAPIHIHIHGGAWRGGSSHNAAYIAEPFVKAGAVFAIPDFAPVQNVGGSLTAMEEQVRRAIAWAYKNASSFGGDADHMYLSAHSSGAHLAACALIADGHDYGIPAAFIKGAVLVSGIYDLKAPRLSSRREYVKFDDATEEALSAQRQSREFSAAVKAVGKPVEFVVGEGYNHFEFIETLGNPYGVLGRAALLQMKLRV